MNQEKKPENLQEQTPVSPEAAGAGTGKEKTDAPETFQSKLPSKKRTALLRYMAVMFAAAFLLVLFSFVMQMRSSNTTISHLSASSASALARAEQLQEENRQLTEDLTTARGYVEAAREEGEAEAANVGTAYDALLKVLSTEEPKDGDVEYAKAVETVRNMKEYLSDDAYVLFEKTLAQRENTEEQ